MPAPAALAPGAAPFRIAPEEIFDWYDGPVEAVARCNACGACAWLELLDWEPRRQLRIYAFAAIRGADVALYLRDRARGSCDAARARAEREALAASAGPCERLVAVELPDLRIVAAAGAAPGLALPAGAWAERIPAPAEAAGSRRSALPKARRAERAEARRVILRATARGARCTGHEPSRARCCSSRASRMG